MRFLIVGAGATGGYFGARLAQAGRDVTFLLRSARAERLGERGLRVHAHDGSVERIDPPIVTAEELSGSYDVVLITVKATGLAGALDDVAPAVGDDTIVIPLLNGLEQLDAVADRFGAGALIAGTVQIVGTLDDDGDVVQMTPLARMAIGALPDSPVPADRVTAIAAELDVPGYSFRHDGDIVGAMWSKWVLIASAGAINVLMRGTVGDVVARPGGADFARAVLGEAAAIAAAYGHPVPRANFDAARDRLTETGSPFTSSLYRDVIDGQPAEGQHLIGDLTDRARRVGVATPLLDLAAMHLGVYETRRS